MNKPIGEFLKEKGLVTGSQLDTALRAQLFYGGHLGTCLMELRLIDESTFGEALAATSRVPYAPARVLKNLSPKTIESLPRKLAVKYRAVPISVDEGTLHLCLIDPRNVTTLDEVAFATGYRVKAWVSPEARIYEALDRYYGVRRSARYIALCRSLEADARAHDRGEPSAAREKSTHAEPPPRTTVVTMSEDASPDLGGEYGYGRSWKDIATDIGIDRRQSKDAPVAAAVRKLQPPQDGLIHPTLWEATDALCRTEKKQDAVDAVLAFTAARMERCIFFGVNDDIATVWDSRGSDFDRRRKSKAAFPVSTERLFELLLGDDFYRGPLDPKGDFLGFYSALGMSAPKEILLVPIYFDDHLVALFYGDGGASGTIIGETDEYLRLFRILPIAVNQIVLRDSMRAIGYYFSEEQAEEAVASGSPKPA